MAQVYYSADTDCRLMRYGVENKLVQATFWLENHVTDDGLISP